ncbi:MAG: hypothetical protein KOO60_09755 [Gemmatimonadales bacterium]|nr:hypothetical protein [Gemmatimonadales bacterium]
MSKKPGCLKTGCFGCLGVTVLLILIVGINFLVAWSRLDDQPIQNLELTRPIGAAPTPAVAGRVLLDLSQGEFYIHPAPEGESLSVKANYDETVFNLEEDLSTTPGSSWTYVVKFHRKVPFLQAIFHQLLSDSPDPEVHVFLPSDVPIELGILVQEGGFEAELGGLWLTEAEIIFRMGGFSLDVSEPLKEPLQSLKIEGSMGGFEADRLGNASPRFLDVNCKMGGAEIDLSGHWLNDCDLNLGIRMGGMAVLLPEDIRVTGVPDISPDPLKKNSEVPVPALNFNMKQKMGEIEVIR